MPQGQAEIARRPRGDLPPSPSGHTTATTTTTTRSNSPAGTGAASSSGAEDREEHDAPFVQQSRRYTDENIRAMLHQLPSSPKQLLRRLEQQQQEIRLLQNENTALKSREVEVSSLTVYLQDRINATQNQVDHIKTQILLQLSNPIAEAEYNRIEALPEPQRDLVDTIKLGIYRQLNSLRTSQQAATQRAAELSTAVAQLQQENADLKVRLAEYEAQGDSQKEKTEKRNQQLASQQARVAELEGLLSSLEAKNKSMYVDQEQYLSAKLTAQVKTDEVARLAVRLEEAEMDTQRYRANAECSEQKLDILKAEYYELKLDYGQRVLKLESALRASEEKLKTLGDLEMESELFISNLAASANGELAFGGSVADVAGADGGSLGTRASAYESWLALPRSRKLAHSLVVTKRCLYLENKVSSLEHELEFKQAQVARLQVALDGARDALNNVNSPYVLVEKAMDELTTTNEALKQKLGVLEHEKKELQAKVQHYGANMRAMTQHRKELLHIKKLLRQLGMREGFVFPSTDDSDDVDDDDDAAAVRPHDATRPSHGREGRVTVIPPSGGVRSPMSQADRSGRGGSLSTPAGSSETKANPPTEGSTPSSFASMQPIEIQS
ncbi:hypothetical protein ABB37_01979 [Leptomonas pyrrhocoris]|uniref:Uncharacterized protein n=1 Tax=Leptomonas pyrrhocoris TaxID=157538 RepID=A0A0M9G766_LEPPY|nr:hypothetical protein ABB37_01979 [Leptomonas pyrrhocoris]KPA83736.1 hypothetical protein ABB37_01979 [Leptomonas pyrrhocoris]|eukprot:XP_015662175.1 hypothetical protein ABB37_01979 [Leptomonas pyrrhocoris]